MKASMKSHSKNLQRDNVEENGLKDILKKKWKVYRVSPMHNLDTSRFKFYEKKLNEELNWKKKMSVMCKSKFTLNQDLRLNEQCAESIRVEITKDESQRVYLGHFISWGNLQDVTDGFTYLPILLVEGKESEINGVHSAICKLFDCDIQPVTFSFQAMITFIVKLLETSRDGVDLSREQVILEYKIPECDDKDRIIVSFLLQETGVVYAIIKQEFEEKFQNFTPLEIIWVFYNKLLNHIFKVYKMDLTLAKLQKVTYSDAFITADGQVKMVTEDAAKSALSVLENYTPLDAVVSF